MAQLRKEFKNLFIFKAWFSFFKKLYNKSMYKFEGNTTSSITLKCKLLFEEMDDCL